MESVKSTEKMLQMLQEWREFEIPHPVERDFDYGILEKSRIVSIIGPRRAGKTWLCYQIIRYLLKKGLYKDNIAYINFEDERLYPICGDELTLLFDAFQQIFDYKKDQDIWLIVDEIQNIPFWSKWVRRITDQYRQVHIIITGSSSKLLSTEIATELRGRSISFTVYPYSYKEFIAAHNKKIPSLKNILYSNKRHELIKLFNNYFYRGGFPAVAHINDYQSILQEYYKAMFTRDIVERFAVSNIRLLEDFLKIQISRFSSLASYSNLEHELNEVGHTFSKNTISTYSKYAQEVFLLKEVLIFSPKVKNQLRYPRKIYGIDHGLINAIRFSVSEDRGRFLENIVFNELMRRNLEVFYFSNKLECDFLTIKNNRITSAIQVCYSLHEEKVKQREINGLREALLTYKLSEGYIITAHEYQDTTIDGLTIFIRPFWLWALEKQNNPKNCISKIQMQYDKKE